MRVHPHACICRIHNRFFLQCKAPVLLFHKCIRTCSCTCGGFFFFFKMQSACVIIVHVYTHMFMHMWKFVNGLAVALKDACSNIVHMYTHMHAYMYTCTLLRRCAYFCLEIFVLKKARMYVCVPKRLPGYHRGCAQNHRNAHQYILV